MAKLTVPIIVKWDDIEEDLAKGNIVKVVRCKDCKHFTRYKDCKEMYMWDGECSEWVSHTYLDWFCNRAERKES